MATKELYQSTLTRGILSASDSRADMVVHVTGLDGGRDNLDNAITSATTGRLVHPDDTTLPLRYATARWVRGADRTNNAEALVFLTYDKRSRSTATDGTEFSNIANVTVRYETVRWWGKTLDTPSSEDGEGTLNEKPDPQGGNAAVVGPQPQFIEVPIWDIEIPAVLSSSPISTVASKAGKVNSPAVTLSGKSFAAKTLRFNGVVQRAVKVDDGVSVTYEFFVNYSFSYREDGWYLSYLKPTGADPKKFAASKQCPYGTTAFTGFPV